GAVAGTARERPHIRSALHGGERSRKRPRAHRSKLGSESRYAALDFRRTRLARNRAGVSTAQARNDEPHAIRASGGLARTRPIAVPHAPSFRLEPLAAHRRCAEYRERQRV